MLRIKAIHIVPNTHKGGMSTSAHSGASLISEASLHDYIDVHVHQSKRSKTTNVQSVPRTVSSQFKSVALASPFAVSEVI